LSIISTKGREVPQSPLREQLRAAFKSTASKSMGWAKNFGIMTALFGGIQKAKEKFGSEHT